MPADFKQNHRSQKRKRLGQKHGSEKKNSGSFRVIGGVWRSRRLSFPAVEGLRPTTDRVRETVFNWLSMHIEGAKVLDLFAGSGSLGLEALSRGAAALTTLELNDAAAKALRENLSLLIDGKGDGKNETYSKQTQVIQTDSLKWLQTLSQGMESYDLVFLDPPFRKGILATCLEILSNSQVLKPDTLVYLERGKEEGVLIPAGWHLLKEKVTGQVCYQLYKVVGLGENH